jgi:small-conductance mechanosensitive channel
VSSEPNTRVAQTLLLAKSNGRDKLEQAVSLLQEICISCVGTDGKPDAALMNASGASYQVNVIFYVAKEAEYLAVVHRVNMEILRRFVAEGIVLA